jgi:hypothetical protein
MAEVQSTTGRARYGQSRRTSHHTEQLVGADGGCDHHRRMDTRDLYVEFARVEAAGSSKTYERLALAVADSPALLDRLDALPPLKRQPNLVLAAARMLGAPLAAPHRFTEFVESNWDEVAAIVRTRATQTNEAARTGMVLPLIAAVDGPVALIEVGCSAGLCLYPDRYAISYDRRPPLVAQSPVTIDVATTGPVPIPKRLPDVVARIGVDLNPIDLTDPEGRAWLEALIWPEHHHRLRRLRAAASVVATDPPMLLRGDLVDIIDAALALVPTAATPIVFHSAVLYYISPEDRQRFADQLAEHPRVVWITNEAPGVVDGLTTDLEPPAGATRAAYFIIGLGGHATIGIGDTHGSWISWAQSD